jgi:hypothetical protein
LTPVTGVDGGCLGVRLEVTRLPIARRQDWVGKAGPFRGYSGCVVERSGEEEGNMSGPRSWAAAAALLVLGALACMPDLVRTETALRADDPADQPSLVLAQPVRVAATKGFGETLAAGSTWKRVGAVEQGEVYKPVGTVFMLTSANAHEAYLVVSSGRVVGFYLPGEEAFAAAAEAVALPSP